MDDSFVTFKKLALMLGFNRAYRIYDWDARGCLPTKIVDGQKCVTLDFANKLAYTWSKTCTPIQAAKALGIGLRGGSIGHLMDKNVLKTVEPFGENFKGYTRVLLESIPSAKVYVEGTEERRIRVAQELGKSRKGHLFTREKARVAGTLAVNRHKFTEEESVIGRSLGSTRGGRTTQIRRRKKNQINSISEPLVLYIPNTLEGLEMVGDKKLVTPKSVAEFLGIHINQLKDLGLRGEYIGEEFIPYAHSVEVYKKRNPVVKEKTPQKKNKGRR